MNDVRTATRGTNVRGGIVGLQATASARAAGHNAADHIKIQMHDDERCYGFGSLLARPEITQLLQVSLRQEGFATRSVVVGISDELKYGSLACHECKTWLRKG